MQIQWGQWIGRVSGTNQGAFILNIDADRTERGHIGFADNKLELSSYEGEVLFKKVGGKLEGHIDEIRIACKGTSEDEIFPENGKLIFDNISAEKLEGTWHSDNGQNGKFVLTRRESDRSELVGEKMEWAEYLAWAFEETSKNKKVVFRGQPDSNFPLKTMFHRTSRRSLTRYNAEDLPLLNKHLGLTVNKTYRLEDSLEFSSLMLLGQHHGYPTPLLDWSFSPFVASFFAFRSPHAVGDSDYSRIYVFEYDRWVKEGQKYRSSTLVDPRFSITPLDLITTDNPRVLPQQAFVTFSNVTDIEGWIMTLQKNKESPFLRAIDIPKVSRAEIMKSLKTMNITAASLFPGLDGLCEALKVSEFY